MPETIATETTTQNRFEQRVDSIGRMYNVKIDRETGQTTRVTQDHFNGAKGASIESSRSAQEARQRGFDDAFTPVDIDRPDMRTRQNNQRAGYVAQHGDKFDTTLEAMQAFEQAITLLEEGIYNDFVEAIKSLGIAY